MPRATVNIEPEHFELKSCPGGFVELRRMTYGEKLMRQELAMNVKFEGSGRTAQGALDIMQRAVAEFEFKNCIVKHNLEDENGTPLNFQAPADVHRLDPKIGEEVGTLISKMNNWEDEPGN